MWYSVKTPIRGEGEQEFTGATYYQRYGLPGIGVYISQFKGRNTGLGPLGASRTRAAASAELEAALRGSGACRSGPAGE
jgi:hypothetical protein